MTEGYEVVRKEKIEFEVQDVEMPSLDLGKVKRWIEKVADSYGYTVRRVSYLFMDDTSMLKANNDYLGHDYYTDIITFDYTREENLLGEILISLDTVKSNSEQLGQPYMRELLRVIIHGILHLCGINDKGPGERAIMESAEDKALAMYEES